MSVNAKMKEIADNIRYRTGKTGLLGLDRMASEILGINWVADAFFAKAARVSNVSEMTDKAKIYFNVSTGTIWRYQNSGNSIETITEPIVGTTGNPYELGRLSSGNANGLSGYVTTPYIDLNKYDAPFTLHLEGIPFNYANDNYRFSQYEVDKTHITTQQSKQATITEWFKNASVVVGDNSSLTITFTPPVINMNGVTVGYARFCGQGTEADANVYITYQEVTTTEGGWIDTGIHYASSQSVVVDDTITLPISPVKAFMDSTEYNSNDYSYTQVTDYVVSGGSRTDLPNPFVHSWVEIENAILYAVSINAQTYYTTENSISVSNFIPNTHYKYSIYALCADGSMVAIEVGTFTTTADSTRMLNIDGIQNVRDIGGYTGLNCKKARYGLIYRGSAMDEDDQNLCITEAGKYEMVSRLGIGADIDLRGANNVAASALGNDVNFYTPQYSYSNYASAITEELHRGYFKDMLEYIVAQLTANKPVYIHCSGGCDRTGTLVFLLLGLIGVSESDLAKEYELSSFSDIGLGRYRSSETYDYSGMVAALKAYSGDTIADKFYDFATTGCGISADTIARFRSQMLE